MKGHRIWKDKNINPEAKEIYAYIYSKGYDRKLIHLNIGEFQSILHIRNVAVRKHLKLLETFRYLFYNEYDNGMYEVTLTK